MFSFGAPVVTISIILDVVIVEVTVIICIARDVAGDDLVEVLGAVAGIGRGRSWSGRLSGSQRDGDDRGS